MPQQTDELTEQLDAAADQAAELLRVLANPARLRILCALVPGPLTVGALVERLGASQSYVSGQLAKVRQENLVTTRRDGRLIYYSLSDPRVTPVLNALYSAFCEIPLTNQAGQGTEHTVAELAEMPD